MSDTEFPDRASADGAEIDPGPPIEALADLHEVPSPAFAAGVLDRINRRTLIGQALDVPWLGFTRVFVEYLQVLLKALGIKDEEEEEG